MAAATSVLANFLVVVDTESNSIAENRVYSRRRVNLTRRRFRFPKPLSVSLPKRRHSQADRRNSLQARSSLLEEHINSSSFLRRDDRILCCSAAASHRKIHGRYYTKSSSLLGASLGNSVLHFTGRHPLNVTLPKQIRVPRAAECSIESAENTEVADLLSTELPSHPNLHRGRLKNGLKYLILPNKLPMNRFEAHMEVHAGSVDEEDDEQGIAHMIEHVAFLGSRKREKLLGTGVRSNAYTDFHHTVFHIHAPTKTDEIDDSLPLVLDALCEIAFRPSFFDSRVEKERRAILSELQMMNTIEYRVDCQLLQQLHSENKLSKRFPIGLEEQIKSWNTDKIRKFHERWYSPANATLYVVGNVDSVSKAVRDIETVFGKIGLEKRVATSRSTLDAFRALPGLLLHPKPSSKLHDDSVPGFLNHSKVLKKEAPAIRAPVKHNWSLPGTAPANTPCTPHIFQHELLQNFSINFFCKTPVRRVETYADLRDVLMKRIFLSTLHFRINTRYKSSNPPFTSIELDHSDSGREACNVTTLTVTAEPHHWRTAIEVAMNEVLRLKKYGLTRGELARYLGAIIKDSEHVAVLMDSVSSVDNLEFVMENDALGHMVMDAQQSHDCLLAVAGTISLEEVNSVGGKLLEFISDFGNPSSPIPAAVVACAPKKVQINGLAETEFKISPGEIIEAMLAGLMLPTEAEPELEVPAELISAAELQELKLTCKPSFMPNGNLHDEETGITQCQLSNGISVNYKISKNESWGGVMRLIVGGGHCSESFKSKGEVAVGVRTLSEGGSVGSFSREQVELFCMNHLINCSLEATEEFISMEFRFSVRDSGMSAAFQLLHMVLDRSVWQDDAFERARQLYLSYYRSIPKSLERATAHELMNAMLNGNERFVEPTEESLQALSMASVRAAVMNQLVAGNMEVSVVGDFSEKEIESCILDYLGTVRTETRISRNSASPQDFCPEIFLPSSSSSSSSSGSFQQVFMEDTDERARAYIAGPAPNRWGFTIDRKDILKDEHGKLYRHPLFLVVTMGILGEILNSRLFTTVRDSLGLTYDVSFELNLLDKLHFGWFVVSVTSTPDKVHEAVGACKNVLRELHENRIGEGELERAKRTILMKHEADVKSNAYWLGLLSHLQAPCVPRKDISCIKDLTLLYQSVSIADVYVAYEQLRVDEDSLYSCIGIAGNKTEGHAPTLEEDEEEEKERTTNLSGLMHIGRGLATMTLPTT